MKVYVASSWRNPIQPDVVKRLRAEGFEVYDFRNPGPGEYGFHWSEIDPNWKTWTPTQFREALEDSRCEIGFTTDFAALDACDAVVLLLPCGRSAHLEAGWASGMGKDVIVALADGEPELMYLMADAICVTLDEVVQELRELRELKEENPEAWREAVAKLKAMGKRT